MLKNTQYQYQIILLTTDCWKWYFNENCK